MRGEKGGKRKRQRCTKTDTHVHVLTHERSHTRTRARMLLRCRDHCNYPLPILTGAVLAHPLLSFSSHRPTATSTSLRTATCLKYSSHQTPTSWRRHTRISPALPSPSPSRPSWAARPAPALATTSCVRAPQSLSMASASQRPSARPVLPRRRAAWCVTLRLHVFVRVCVCVFVRVCVCVCACVCSIVSQGGAAGRDSLGKPRARR